MATNSVLVLGASGWLGSTIKDLIPGSIPIATREVLARGADETLGEALRQHEIRNPVVVNAAGLKHGSIDELTEVNVSLVLELANFVAKHDGRLIQLGSAAEYGLSADTSWITAATKCNPTSDYGVTKLAGTAAAVRSETAIVLRMFNILANPPQVGSPLADIQARILKGVRSGSPVELLCAGTARDYATRNHVAQSVQWATRNDATGIYNVCSGIAVRVGDIAARTVARLDSDIAIKDLQVVPPTTIAGDPTPWRELSGLVEHVNADAIAELLAA